MLRNLRPRSVYDVMAAIGCFAALAGGTAYAANTIGTGDIIDNQFTSADVRDDNLGFGGLAAQDLGPDAVRSSEIAPFATNDIDIATSAINSRHVNNGTLNDGRCRRRTLSSSIAGTTRSGSTTTRPAFATPPRMWRSSATCSGSRGPSTGDTSACAAT